MRGLQASHRRLLGEPDDETAMDMLPSGFIVMQHACSSSPPDTTSSSCCAAYGVILPTPEDILGQLFPRFKTVSTGACSGHCSESEKLAPEIERSEHSLEQVNPELENVVSRELCTGLSPAECAEP